MKTIPADIPQNAHKLFEQHYNGITKSSDRLFLFAGDQKIEHLNKDFYGNNIAPDALNPRHLFEIANKGTIGVFATHPGLIARYGNEYKDVLYIAKLNGKTNLISTEQRDPMSQQLWSVQDVIRLRQESGLHIYGVGYTIYLGSEYETVMLSQAAQMIYQAHQVGLVTILWIYPRGKAITHDADPELLAGAVGLGHALGADFVKIKTPESKDKKSSAEWLNIITQAAGNSGVICAGGQQVDEPAFLHTVYKQIHIGNTAGAAVGRNIFQRSIADAINMTKAIAAIVYKNKTAEEATQLL